MIELAGTYQITNRTGDEVKAVLDNFTSTGSPQFLTITDGLVVGTGTATGAISVAEGSGTTASGSQSHAEGYYTTASGAYCHAEGYYTTASGAYCHAEGYYTTASWDCSHAEGYYTTARNSHSHAEGCHTTASSYHSHAEGYYTTASGTSSHAEGHHTTASGAYCHAEGYHTTASGDYSHTGGYCTTASGDYQTIIGKYNDSTDTNSLFVIGCGTVATGENLLTVGLQDRTSQGTGGSVDAGVLTIYRNYPESYTNLPSVEIYGDIEGGNLRKYIAGSTTTFWEDDTLGGSHRYYCNTNGTITSLTHHLSTGLLALDQYSGVRASYLADGCQYRNYGGNYGCLWRNDSSDTYFLFTASGSAQTGSWNSYRPLRMNNSTGVCYITTSSDLRLKNQDSIEETSDEEAFEILNNLNIVNYTYSADEEGVVFNGIIAQELKALLKEKNIGYRPYLIQGYDGPQYTDEEVEEYEFDEEYLIELEEECENQAREELSSFPEESIQIRKNQLIFDKKKNYLLSKTMQSTDLDIEDDKVGYSIDYTKMVPLTIKGWQLHQKEIEDLKDEIALLKEEIKSLKEAINNGSI